MTDLFVHGCGAVSPAGWTSNAVVRALQDGSTFPAEALDHPSARRQFSVRRAPQAGKPACLNHPRLRRVSPVSLFAVAAAAEAVQRDLEAIRDRSLRLGIILSVWSGSVRYSRRFYDEAMRDPSTASPLVFPETVFNAPASHIAAVLGSTAINYTLVGDATAFLQGLALAEHWLAVGRVDGCVVVAAEESDWLTADAYRLFDRATPVSEGAGAVYLKLHPHSSSGVRLSHVSEPVLFLNSRERASAAREAANAIAPRTPAPLLCDSTGASARLDAAEEAAIAGWTARRLQVKRTFGEGLAATAAWQCVAAIGMLESGAADAGHVLVTGLTEHACGAVWHPFSRL